MVFRSGTVPQLRKRTPAMNGFLEASDGRASVVHKYWRLISRSAKGFKSVVVPLVFGRHLLGYS